MRPETQKPPVKEALADLPCSGVVLQVLGLHGRYSAHKADPHATLLRRDSAGGVWRGIKKPCPEEATHQPLPNCSQDSGNKLAIEYGTWGVFRNAQRVRSRRMGLS